MVSCACAKKELYCHQVHQSYVNVHVSLIHFISDLSLPANSDRHFHQFYVLKAENSQWKYSLLIPIQTLLSKHFKYLAGFIMYESFCLELIPFIRNSDL